MRKRTRDFSDIEDIIMEWDAILSEWIQATFPEAEDLEPSEALLSL